FRKLFDEKPKDFLATLFKKKVAVQRQNAAAVAREIEQLLREAQKTETRTEAEVESLVARLQQHESAAPEELYEEVAATVQRLKERLATAHEYNTRAEQIEREIQLSISP